MTKNSQNLKDASLPTKLEAATIQTDYLYRMMNKMAPTDEEYEALKEAVFIAYGEFKKASIKAPEATLKEAFAKELVRNASKKTGIVGALMSIPLTLPYLGTFMPFVFRIGTLFSFATRSQIEMIYALAALYDYPWKGKELKAIAFVLIGLSDYDDIKKFAASMGVKLTVKKFVVKLAGLVSVELLSHAVKGFYGPMMARTISSNLLTRSPWYLLPLKYGPGSAIGAYFAYTSTAKVGERALLFFGDMKETD